ncbi:hypothetical protein E2542_SST27982 [Spatholobus suberectus]|nr:hypothetical protein E2542_SST27982 [Spatholobus suberectus]
MTVLPAKGSHAVYKQSARIIRFHQQGKGACWLLPFDFAYGSRGAVESWLSISPRGQGDVLGAGFGWKRLAKQTRRKIQHSSGGNGKGEFRQWKNRACRLLHFDFVDESKEGVECEKGKGEGESSTTHCGSGNGGGGAGGHGGYGSGGGGGSGNSDDDSGCRDGGNNGGGDDSGGDNGDGCGGGGGEKGYCQI